MSSAEQFARGFTTQFASVLTCPSLNSLLESHLLEVTHDADLSDPHHVQQVIEGLVLQAASELPKRVPEELGERLRGSPAKSHRQIFVPGSESSSETGKSTVSSVGPKGGSPGDVQRDYKHGIPAEPRPISPDGPHQHRQDYRQNANPVVTRAPPFTAEPQSPPAEGRRAYGPEHKYPNFGVVPPATGTSEIPFILKDVEIKPNQYAPSSKSKAVGNGKALPQPSPSPPDSTPPMASNKHVYDTEAQHVHVDTTGGLGSKVDAEPKHSKQRQVHSIAEESDPNVKPQRPGQFPVQKARGTGSNNESKLQPAEQPQADIKREIGGNLDTEPQSPKNPSTPTIGSGLETQPSNIDSRSDNGKTAYVFPQVAPGLHIRPGMNDSYASKNGGNGPRITSPIETLLTPEEDDSDDSEDPRGAVEPPPVTAKEHHVYISNFITENNLTGLYDLNSPRVLNLARLAANRAEEITTKYGLSPEETPKLTKLALYDFVILCDDSWSMQQEQRIPALKDTLARVAEIATILDPSGISIRFLNYTKDQKFDNLTTVEQIKVRVDAVKFDGVTKLGSVLNSKIVQPMIIRKAARETFEKPVIVVIITDGEPTFEDRDTLRNTIRNCKRSPALEKFGKAAAVFLISRVGSSDEAKEFLDKLEGDRELEEMVYCSKEKLDVQMAVFQRAKDNVGYTAYLIKLFLAALDSQTK